MTQHDDKTLDYLESQIPDLAAAAVTVAYWATLASGRSVLQVENDHIVEVFPDGTKRLVKSIEPGVELQADSNLNFKP